jgi:hypothetical protein
MLDDLDVKRLLIRTAARDAQASERPYRPTMPLPAGVAARIVARRGRARVVVHDAGPKIGARLAAGARLAVSVEPAGGSPTGAPTGPVILVGPLGG